MTKKLPWGITALASIAIVASACTSAGTASPSAAPATAAPATAAPATAAPATATPAPATAAPAAGTEQVDKVNDAGLSLAGKVIGVEAIGTDHYWDRMAFQGMQEQLKKMGATVIAVDAGRDDQKQVSDLENLLVQKPDAIVNILGTQTVLEPVFAKIKAAGIPLFGVDMASENMINNTTSDNVKLGTELAERMVADMGGKGQIAAFNGFYGINVCALRYDAMKAVLAKNPAVTIIQPELQDVIPNTQEGARKDVQDLLQKYPVGQIGAVWGCWDIPGIGANQAIVEAGRQAQVKYYGVDGDPTVLEIMAQPGQALGGDAAQQPKLIGQISAVNIARVLSGATVAKTTLVPAYLATPENVVEVRKILGQTP
jgi:ribose transport system substrate-binding protein